MQSKDYIQLEDTYNAHNYHPLDVVIERAQGPWVWDVEGKKYLDCLSAYSAVNQGHCHPRIIQAMIEQAEKVTLTSRAFRNDQLPLFAQELCELTGYEMMLPMNTGAEAVETALKAARLWGYEVKGVPEGQAEIIACTNNFHGRTISIITFSTEPLYRNGFGPYTPGFKVIPYGDAAALEAAITPNTVAFLAEPIQGEAGVIIPPEGYLGAVRELCTRHNVLFIADEIQTGLGRAGQMLACDWEGVKADLVTIGKALSGGVLPVSAVIGRRDVLLRFKYGSHGSTFGGSPLGSAVARAALRVIVDEQLPMRARELGAYFKAQLEAMHSPYVKEIRGKGLLIGVELTKATGNARPFCEKLMQRGILAKETHESTIRFAPALVITQEELDWALGEIRAVLN